MYHSRLAVPQCCCGSDRGGDVVSAAIARKHHELQGQFLLIVNRNSRNLPLELLQHDKTFKPQDEVRLRNLHIFWQNSMLA
jgi:hypothetical protein